MHGGASLRLWFQEVAIEHIEVGRAPAEVAGPLHGAGLRIVVFADGAAARQSFGIVEQLVDQCLGIAAIAVVFEPLHPEVELI